jgi:predicted TIM-barrel fold metal-dependent hydrolase
MIVDIHAHIGHHPIHEFDQEPEELLAVMDKYEIERTFVFPFPSMKMKKVNDSVAEAVKHHPNRFIGFACIDPSSEDAVKEVSRAVDVGLKGIMLDPEFHNVFGRRPLYTPQIDDILARCVEHGLPVLFNTPNIEVGESASYMFGGTFECYYRGLKNLVPRFPEVRFIVNSIWPMVTELMNEYPNIIIDTGGQNGISQALHLRIQDVGPMRICFGSESPQNHQAIGMKYIKYMTMKPLFREMVLGRNAERIFKDLF